MANLIPPPSRIPIGYVMVNGQRMEVFPHPEFARYVEQLNTQVVVTSNAVGLPGAPGTTGAAGSGLSLLDDAADSLEFIPGPKGDAGAQGAVGAALFFLQDEALEESPLFPASNSVLGTLGTQTSDDALPGRVGEYVTGSFSSVAMGGSVIDLASLSLPAGDWDVDGGAEFTGSTENILNAAAGISTVSATFGSAGTFFQFQGAAAQVVGSALPTVRISIAAMTTVYVAGFASFSSGTVSSSGIVRARRVR